MAYQLGFLGKKKKKKKAKVVAVRSVSAVGPAVGVPFDSGSSLSDNVKGAIGWAANIADTLFPTSKVNSTAPVVPGVPPPASPGLGMSPVTLAGVGLLAWFLLKKKRR